MLFRLAQPSPFQSANPYTCAYHDSASRLIVLSRWFPLTNINSFYTTSFLRVQGFGRRPSQPIRERSSANSLVSDSRLEIAGITFLSGIKMRFPSSLPSGILISLTLPLILPGYNKILAIQLLMIRQQEKFPHHSLSPQGFSVEMALADFDYLKWWLPPWAWLGKRLGWPIFSGITVIIPTVLKARQLLNGLFRSGSNLV